MLFHENLITPKEEDIYKIQSVDYSGGQNISVYSFTSDKKSHYLSHVYCIDKKQNGKEFIYGPKGEFIAEIPLFEGKANGIGMVYSFPGCRKKQYFYYGKVIPPLFNDDIIECDGDENCVELSATLSGFFKENLEGNKLPDYIVNTKENTMKNQFFFEPVAQNTIIRPLAQAVCLARGGEDVSYVDTADHKTKVITDYDLSSLPLYMRKKGKMVKVEGQLVAFRARHEDISIHVLINDVFVIVTRQTTVNSAMAEFYRKMDAYNRKMMCHYESRQHE